MAECEANGCSNKPSKDLEFFSFPENEEQREGWINALQKPPGWQPTRESKICSVHFVMRQVSPHPWHPDYVPSVFRRLRTKKRDKSSRARQIIDAELGLDDKSSESYDDKLKYKKPPISWRGADEGTSYGQDGRKTIMEKYNIKKKKINESFLLDSRKKVRVGELSDMEWLDEDQMSVQSGMFDSHDDNDSLLEAPEPRVVEEYRPKRGSVRGRPRGRGTRRGSASNRGMAHTISVNSESFLAAESAGDGNDTLKCDNCQSYIQEIAALHEELNAKKDIMTKWDAMVNEHCTSFQRELELYKNEVKTLREKVSTLQLTEEFFQKKKHCVTMYTGLPNYSTLMTLFTLVKAAVPEDSHIYKISHFQKFILCLMRLKMNLKFKDLAYRFNIDFAKIERFFPVWIDAMHSQLSHVLVWPHDNVDHRLNVLSQSLKEHYKVIKEVVPVSKFISSEGEIRSTHKIETVCASLLHISEVSLSELQVQLPEVLLGKSDIRINYLKFTGKYVPPPEPAAEDPDKAGIKVIDEKKVAPDESDVVKSEAEDTAVVNKLPASEEKPESMETDRPIKVSASPPEASTTSHRPDDEVNISDSSKQLIDLLTEKKENISDSSASSEPNNIPLPVLDPLALDTNNEDGKDTKVESNEEVAISGEITGEQASSKDVDKTEVPVCDDQTISEPVNIDSNATNMMDVETSCQSAATELADDNASNSVSDSTTAIAIISGNDTAISTTSISVSDTVTTTSSGASDTAVATASSGVSDTAVATASSGVSDTAVATASSGASDTAVATASSGASDTAVATASSGASDAAVATTSSGASDTAVATASSNASDIAVSTANTIISDTSTLNAVAVDTPVMTANLAPKTSINTDIVPDSGMGTVSAETALPVVPESLAVDKVTFNTVTTEAAAETSNVSEAAAETSNVSEAAAETTDVSEAAAETTDVSEAAAKTTNVSEAANSGSIAASGLEIPAVSSDSLVVSTEGAMCSTSMESLMTGLHNLTSGVSNVDSAMVSVAASDVISCGPTDSAGTPMDISVSSFLNTLTSTVPSSMSSGMLTTTEVLTGTLPTSAGVSTGMDCNSGTGAVHVTNTTNVGTTQNDLVFSSTDVPSVAADLLSELMGAANSADASSAAVTEELLNVANALAANVADAIPQTELLSAPPHDTTKEAGGTTQQNVTNDSMDMQERSQTFTTDEQMSVDNVMSGTNSERLHLECQSLHEELIEHVELLSEQLPYNTKLPTFDLFQEFVKYGKDHTATSLSVPAQTVPHSLQCWVTLIKLKLNLDNMDLSFCYNISVTDVEKIFEDWLKILSQEMALQNITESWLLDDALVKEFPFLKRNTDKLAKTAMEVCRFIDAKSKQTTDETPKRQLIYSTSFSDVWCSVGPLQTAAQLQELLTSELHKMQLISRKRPQLTDQLLKSSSDAFVKCYTGFTDYDNLQDVFKALLPGPKLRNNRNKDLSVFNQFLCVLLRLVKNMTSEEIVLRTTTPVDSDESMEQLCGKQDPDICSLMLDWLPWIHSRFMLFVTWPEVQDEGIEFLRQLRQQYLYLNSVEPHRRLQAEAVCTALHNTGHHLYCITSEEEDGDWADQDELVDWLF